MSFFTIFKKHTKQPVPVKKTHTHTKDSLSFPVLMAIFSGFQETLPLPQTAPHPGKILIPPSFAIPIGRLSLPIGEQKRERVSRREFCGRERGGAPVTSVDWWEGVYISNRYHFKEIRLSYSWSVSVNVTRQGLAPFHPKAPLFTHGRTTTYAPEREKQKRSLEFHRTSWYRK